jgi:hypothetical protein
MNTYDPETGQWTTDGDRYDAIVARPPYAALDDEIYGDPGRAWPHLLQLVAEIDDGLLEFAGAGPLETFVIRHAAAFIGRIEAQAQADERFRECLSRIWLTDGHLGAEVQQRLVAATEGRIIVLPDEKDTAAG